MRFHFYSPVAFEPWDFRNSVETGIGGSETSHVEMSWRLARRGHEVMTYAPIPEDCPGKWRHTHWFSLKDADFMQSGIWVLYRCPSVVDEFLLQSPRTHPVWLMFQDWSYPDLTPARIARCQRLITLCHAHGRDLRKRYPTGADRIWITSNGLKTDLLTEVEAEGPIVRDPHKIMYASSPDRGLMHVIRSVQRAREIVPDLTLHAFYGFNNLDKLVDQLSPQHGLRKTRDETKALLESPGVVWHGRVDQRTLYREWLSAGLWCYQTNFSETSCVSCMEAQAGGAIPIVNPVYALAENVHHGIAIEGDAYGDPLTKARFAAEIIRASDPVFQDRIRPVMMADARQRFDWERFVTQWEEAARDDLRQIPRLTSNNPKAPALSVITPSIRPEGLLPVWECLQRQTYQHWEWLIALPRGMSVPAEIAGDRRVRVFTERHHAADFYQLNKTWNLLIAEAKGDALVSATDWLWFEDDALQRLAQRYLADLQTAISVPTSHIHSIETRNELTWVDYRLLQGQECSDCPMLEPSAVELNFALLPGHAVLDVGGFDETYDQVAGFSEKDLAARLHVQGIRFVLEKRLQARAIEHPKEWPNWDLKIAEGRQKFDADYQAVLRGERRRVKGAADYAHV